MVDKLTPIEAEVLELPSKPEQAEEREDSYGTAPMPKPKKNYVGLWICFGLAVIALCTFSVFATVFNVRLSRNADGKWSLQSRNPVTDAVEQDPIRELPAPEAGGNSQETEVLSADAAQVDLEQNQTLQEPVDPAELYRAVSPSVVRLKMASYASVYYDTGIVITEDGFLLSAVNEQYMPRSIEAEFSDGSTKSAEIVVMDRTTGICLLKVEAADLTPAQFDFEAPLQVGEKVYCISNPYEAAMMNVLTEGMLSASRELALEGLRVRLLQTSVDLQSSGYGIPILDEKGAIVGMTTALGQRLLDSGEDPCFGVSAADLKQILNRMISRAAREEESFGITVEEIPDYYQIMFGFPGTLWVKEVSEDSPMYQRLDPFDVITAVNNVPVTTVEEYQNAVQTACQGGTVCLTVFRNGSYYYATIPVKES